MIIVGNKSDLVEQREISSDQLQELGQENHVHTFETSAKTGSNVDNAFNCLIYQVLKPCLAVQEQIALDS